MDLTCPRVACLRATWLPTERVEDAKPWTATFAFDSNTVPRDPTARVGAQVTCTSIFLPQPVVKFHTVTVDADRAVRVQGRWPRHRADRWCDHCCHPFDPPGVPLPVSHNSRTDVFTVRGVFCSFSCAKAFNYYSRYAYPSMPLATETLAMFRKRCTGRMDILRAAPPRQALKVFGGWLSIDDFRASVEEVHIALIPPKMVLHEQLMEVRARAASAPTPQPKRAAEQPVQYTAELPRNETLRLKRHKPLPNKNALGRLGFLK